MRLKREITAGLIVSVTSVASLPIDAATNTELSMPSYQEDSVFIYSNGAVEKLLEKGTGWFVIEDMRKKRYKFDLNFTVPPLEYKSLTSQYRQSISSGNPDSLFLAGQNQHSNFTITRDRPNRPRTQANWSCSPLEHTTLKIMKKNIQTLKTTCSRFSWTKIKERVDLYYDPKTAWLVKRISHKKGKRRVRELVAVISPEQASSKRITSIVRKLKNKS